MCRQMKDEETDEDGRQGALLRGRKKAQGLGVEVAEAGRGDGGRTVGGGEVGGRPP